MLRTTISRTTETGTERSDRRPGLAASCAFAGLVGLALGLGGCGSFASLFPASFQSREIAVPTNAPANSGIATAPINETVSPVVPVVAPAPMDESVSPVVSLGRSGKAASPIVTAVPSRKSAIVTATPLNEATKPLASPEFSKSSSRPAGTERVERVHAGFSTRFASFEPAGWDTLPGWEDDALGEAWSAFRRSCDALGRKRGWEHVCDAAMQLGPADDSVIRQFLEEQFSLYAIRNRDRSLEGVITGYYEPLLNGSRTRRGPFIYPVYATPDDLLTLDIRRVPAMHRGQPIGARIEGRTVIPDLSGNAPYVLHTESLKSVTLDKKLRLRREGTRIVPYPIRAQIERDGLSEARVLAWVDNLAALYSMQIQGSGRVLLDDGRVIRLAYAQQNGHPFRPPVRKRRSTTRGIGVHPAKETDFDDVYWRRALMMPDTFEFSEAEVMTRGGLLRAKDQAAEADDGSAGASLTTQVQRLIEDLSSGQRVGGVRSDLPPASTQVLTGGAEISDALRTEEGRATVEPAVREEASPRSGSKSTRQSTPVVTPASVADSKKAVPTTFPQPSAAMRKAILNDPSYVFFREIPDGPGGPIGALGVPLTAERSVAVDPRTTPLGSPVFLSIKQPGRVDFVNRLVVAQDTGGAIRGAVRADYFWGFGHSAYVQAAHMKESGRMWVMLPRDLPIAARDEALRTRGIGQGALDFECVVEEPDLCVEDP